MLLQEGAATEPVQRMLINDIVTLNLIIFNLVPSFHWESNQSSRFCPRYILPAPKLQLLRSLQNRQQYV